LGNAVSYYVTSSTNDKSEQGYENKILGGGAKTLLNSIKI